MLCRRFARGHMETLDPIDEQLVQYLKSDKILAFSNSKYDLLIAINHDWLEIKKNEDVVLIYAKGAWNIPRKTVKREVLFDLDNETYELAKADREWLLSKMNECPYVLPISRIQNMSQINLKLHRIDEAFSYSFLCFNYGNYENLPLVKIQNTEITDLDILISNQEFEGSIRLVLVSDYNDTCSIIFRYIAEESTRYEIAFGVGVKLLFGENMTELFVRIKESEWEKIRI